MKMLLNFAWKMIVFTLDLIEKIYILSYLYYNWLDIEAFAI